MGNKVNLELHNLIHNISLLNNESDRRIFSKYKLRSVRFYSLRHLHEKKQLTLGELSDLVLIDRASASRMIFSMEKDGLVSRTDDPNDRRLFKLALTKNGEALYKQVKTDLDADIAERLQSYDAKTVLNTLEVQERLKLTLEQHLKIKLNI